MIRLPSAFQRITSSRHSGPSAAAALDFDLSDKTIPLPERCPALCGACVSACFTVGSLRDADAGCRNRPRCANRNPCRFSQRLFFFSSFFLMLLLFVLPKFFPQTSFLNNRIAFRMQRIRTPTSPNMAIHMFAIPNTLRIRISTLTRIAKMMFA